MHLSGFSRSALVLAGLCVLATPAAAGCGPSAAPAARHPADQLIDANDVPPGFTRAAQPTPASLGCPALDQALRPAGDHADVTFGGKLDDITERITTTPGTSEADAVLRAVAESIPTCPTHAATRGVSGIPVGPVLAYAPLGPLPAVGDDSVVTRVNQGTGLFVLSTELMVIRKGATVVELRHGVETSSTDAGISDVDLAKKALAHLG